MVPVVHTHLQDLDDVYRLFDYSVHYQELKGYPVWKNYDKQAIVNDIENKKQYKALVEGQMAIVFSVRYDDKIIWRELDKGRSLYLHRIVVNPKFKGRQLFGIVLDWAIADMHERGLENIRMDTWAENPNMISYYQRFGFAVVGHYTTPDSKDLPVHNRNLALTLLEYQPKQ